MYAFIVRPGFSSGEPLIEFRGDHRASTFPSILRILESRLADFSAQGSEPAPDDFLWEVSYSGGTFEVSNDWGGLFILPRTNSQNVISDVSSALISSGVFIEEIAA